MLEKHMEKFRQEMEIEGTLAGKKPGIYEIPLEENLTVVLKDKSSGFELACTLGSAKKEQEELFYTTLMFGNLFGEATSGAVLGLTEDGNLLTLSQSIDYNADYKDFKIIIEEFIESVDFWRDESSKYK